MKPSIMMMDHATLEKMLKQEEVQIDILNKVIEMKAEGAPVKMMIPVAHLLYAILQARDKLDKDTLIAVLENAVLTSFVPKLPHSGVLTYPLESEKFEEFLMEEMMNTAGFFARGPCGKPDCPNCAKNCIHCKMSLKEDNPSGHCNHKDYPNNCDTCKIVLQSMKEDDKNGQEV